jgi:hypothetical protein
VVRLRETERESVFVFALLRQLTNGPGHLTDGTHLRFCAPHVHPMILPYLIPSRTMSIRSHCSVEMWLCAQPHG